MFNASTMPHPRFCDYQEIHSMQRRHLFALSLVAAAGPALAQSYPSKVITCRCRLPRVAPPTSLRA
jgi:hypothetical protein